MKILLVDDENTLRESLSIYLQKEGFTILQAADFAQAKNTSLKGVDLILLDWMLPDGNGLDLLRHWRSQGHQIPVIFLTAKVDVIDKVLGLESGSNDYVTKPFDPRELLARIRSHLRRPLVSQLSLNDIVMQLETRQVTYKNQEISLTKTEFDLLKFFMSHPEKAFSRDEILQTVWGYDQFPTTRTVDVHVMQLRQNLSADFFETVHGIGYKMKRLK